MTEQELRALVRQAISRHDRGAASYPGTRSGPAEPSQGIRRSTPGPYVTPLVQQHASHALFVLPAGADTEGPCIIEPAVPCTHCGYCKSFGH